MGDRIHVPIELEGFDVGPAEVIHGVLEVDVASTRAEACHHCGSVDVIGHGRTIRRIRDRACGYPTVLRWSQRRFKCRDCKRTCRERHPELPGTRSITKRFRYRLFERAVARPFTDIAAEENVSSYRVLEAFEWHATIELLETHYQPPRVVAIDESAFRKHLRFHTVLSDPERGIVFDLVEGRDRASALTAFARMEPQVRAQVETVVMDPHWQFRQAAEQMFPHARIVADKFHIIRAITYAAQKVRKEEGRRKVPRREDGRLAPRSHHKRFEPSIFQIRWIFAKRASRLSEQERQRLRIVFDMKPRIEVAWLMKEAFNAIYDAPDRTEGKRRLEVWIFNLDAAGLPGLITVWKQLDRWREQILAYFDDGMTNAFAEGITNKIKVMKRVSYGFRNSERYRQKVLLSFRHRRSLG